MCGDGGDAATDGMAHYDGADAVILMLMLMYLVGDLVPARLAHCCDHLEHRVALPCPEVEGVVPRAVLREVLHHHNPPCSHPQPIRRARTMQPSTTHPQTIRDAHTIHHAPRTGPVDKKASKKANKR